MKHNTTESENSEKLTSRVENILSGLKIAVIDDSRSFCKGVEDLLSTYKCTVQTFTDPKLAIEKLPESKPDIIITDYELGELNVLDVIKSIKQHQAFQTVPILVLTSRNETEILVSTMLAGADAFTSKEAVREVLIAELVTLARVKLLYQEVIRLGQFTALKAMIATYKHEFGNVLTIIDGQMRKLKKSFPTMIEDESYKIVQENLIRMNVILQKLAALREYQEHPYFGSDSIIKIE